MPSRNTQLAAVRLWLHDHVCLSECTGQRAVDHARRTQHATARPLVDTHRAAAPSLMLAGILHDHRCRTGAHCEHRDAHIARDFTRKIPALIERLEGTHRD